MTSLTEILEMNYKSKDKNFTDMNEIYGIIYRIYCIPEDKSYIGQTFSHVQTGKYYCRYGVINRCKQHYRDRLDDLNKNRPLYQALNKYPSNQFTVFTEIKIEGKELANLNQIEGEYMERYITVHPDGYNVEEVGKRYPKLLSELAKYYKFEINHFVYEDKTRVKRCKDICAGIRFGLKRDEVTPEKVFECLKKIQVESIRIVDSNGFRLVIKEKGTIDNIRVYFKGSKEDCLEYAKRIHPNVIIADSFKGGYEYQTKLDEALAIDNIKKVSYNRYKNSSNEAITYLIIFYGDKNKAVLRVSFGGKTIDSEVSHETSGKFMDKFITEYKNTNDVEYKLLIN